MISLKNKWALITGASRGVGRQIAKGLAQQGCNLVLHSRQRENTSALEAELSPFPITICRVSAELSDQTQVERMLNEVTTLSPQIDILYNNAAIMTPYRANPWDIPVEDFRKSFEVNVITVARICYRLVPLMIERHWGRVINLTSGIRNEPQLTPYAVSKAALDKFVYDFVPTLNNTGVAMNLLDPGWLRTDMGGPKATNAVESVFPGALVPAFLSKPASGFFFQAQDYAGLGLEEALEKFEG
jgi:3-oxoacyl-[acyl-carrier protein] reductase